MTDASADRSRIRPADLTALALVGLTVAVAALAYPRLSGEVVVGWHVGLDGTLSRTRGPRALAVGLFPALAAGCYALFRTVAATAPLEEDRATTVYDLVVNLVLAALAATQGLIVLANL